MRYTIVVTRSYFTDEERIMKPSFTCFLLLVCAGPLLSRSDNPGYREGERLLPIRSITTKLPIYDLDISPDGLRFVATSGQETAVKVWSLESMKVQDILN